MSGYPVKKAVAFDFPITLFSKVTGLPLVDPTIVTGDAKISKDYGAEANLTTLPAVTPSGTTTVVVSVSGTEADADDIVIKLADAAGDEWLPVDVYIKTSTLQIDDLSTQASVDVIDGIVDAILVDTSDLQTNQGNWLTATGFAVAGDAMTLTAAGVDSILDEVVEGTTTLRQSIRLQNSAMLAKVSGGATVTNTFRDIGDTKDRITATVDADGNRTAVTLDGS